MALQSQAWAWATPMPMAESNLYRQRLEVIAEKRRLQENIRAARRELEEERLRAQRLKRKSLRERWLMDGAAEAPADPPDPASPSPEAQAQTRIRSLEDSLFTLQAQLQLLQSASTGAQHRPAARPVWRRQGLRPLSHPAMEASPAGRADPDKRASLPSGPVAVSPRSQPEPREGAPGVQATPRLAPGTGGSSESNGPYCGLSPAGERELGPQADTAEAKRGDVVEVVWEGLRPPEDNDTVPAGPELEAKVEEAVLEAIGDRQAADSPELPAWVREDGAVVEVVWEGLGGSGVEARPTEECRAGAEAPGGRPGESGPGDPAGEEGSFLWVERVTIGEDWELVMEGLEGLEGPTAPPGAEGGGEAWEVERGMEGSRGTAERGLEEEREGREAQEDRSEGDRGEGPMRVDGAGQTVQEQGKGKAGVEEEVDRSLAVQGKDQSPLDGERKGGEGPPDGERQDIKAPLSGETPELGKEPSSGESGERAEPQPEEGSVQLEDGSVQPEEGIVQPEDGSVQPEEGSVQPEDGSVQPEEGSVQLEDGSVQPEEGSIHLEEGSVQPEKMPEEPGLQPQVGPEGFLEEEVRESEAPAAGPGGDASSLLAETPAPQPPTESQPLLQREGPSTHPVPTYAPARQPVPTEGEEVNGPKQKTCQCCEVM
ncbi:paralemmin-3 [Thomomys bottae]